MGSAFLPPVCSVSNSIGMAEQRGSEITDVFVTGLPHFSSLKKMHHEDKRFARS